MSDQSVAAGNFDYIIVGGGSAGCVMASRLSEDPVKRVLLIEAGRDYAAGSEPKEISDPAAPVFFNFSYFMPMTGAGAALSGGGNAQVPLPQASVMGGGSSVNGMHAQRGDASDYDEWRQLGVSGWSWEEVLPFFKKTETDLDFHGEEHGDSGPIKIKRQGQETWSKLSLAVAKAFDAEGIPHQQDLNTSSGPGYGAVPLNATDKRMSSAAAYLTPSVRSRQNLSILSSTKVRRVVFEGQRACGVELIDDAATIVKGANVVLCCGAFLSPELLLRSGIGAAQDLIDAGIPVVADRPGVGKNFQNHAIINVFAHITPAARQTGLARAPCLMVARLSSNNPSCPPADLIFNLWERAPGCAPNNLMGRQMADFMFVLNKAYSVGEIVLDPANPAGPASVRTNLLSDQRDLDRVMGGFKYLAELAQSSQMRGLVNEVFAMKPSPVGIMMLQQHWKARVVSTLAGAALGGPASLRRMFLKNAIIPINDIIATPAKLEAHVRETVGPAHSGGTCSLGDPRSPMTVVDEYCNVIGVDGLRVVDASIFPRLMRAGTNLPTMMAAEKVAHAIQQGH